MGETNEGNQGTPQATGQSSEAGKGGTSTPRTYTETELQKVISDRLTEQGRTHKAALETVTKERDGLKTQVETLTKTANDATTAKEETKATIAVLEADLDQALQGAPDAAEIAKLKRELRAEKAKLNTETQAEKDAIAAAKKALEAEKAEWGQTVEETRAMKLEKDVREVAEGYEGGDAGKLKTACEKAGLKSREQIEAIAGSFWTKKGEQTIVPDSGLTTGVGVDTSKLSPSQKIAYAMAHPKK